MLYGRPSRAIVHASAKSGLTHRNIKNCDIAFLVCLRFERESGGRNTKELFA